MKKIISINFNLEKLNCRVVWLKNMLEAFLWQLQHQEIQITNWITFLSHTKKGMDIFKFKSHSFCVPAALSPFSLLYSTCSSDIVTVLS